VHDGGPLQPCAVLNFPNTRAYTRSTEMRWLTGQAHAKTSLYVEYPRPFESGVNEPYYPIPQPRNAELFARYQAELAAAPDAPIVLGRLGDYRYYNMDQAVARALSVFEQQIAPHACRA
jgi:UDP-galactopyranose mutase